VCDFPPFSETLHDFFDGHIVFPSSYLNFGESLSAELFCGETPLIFNPVPPI